MKKLVKIAVLTLSTGMMAVSAIAAPIQHAHENTHAHIQKHHPQGQVHVEQRHREIVQNRVLKPSRDWRAGQALPSRYYGQGYRIDHKRYKHLSKPGKNQRWIRVNGDYILINTINHTILKIIAE